MKRHAEMQILSGGRHRVSVPVSMMKVVQFRVIRVRSMSYGETSKVLPRDNGRLKTCTNIDLILPWLSRILAVYEGS